MGVPGRIAFALAICIAPVSAAFGQTGTPVTTAATQALLRAALDQQQLATPAGRLALVKAVQSYCAEIGSVYPRNSPEEDAWIKAEAAGGGDRPERVLRSPEFGRRMAANFVQDCIAGAQAYEAIPDKRGALLVMSLAFARFGEDATYYATQNRSGSVCAGPCAGATP